MYKSIDNNSREIKRGEIYFINLSNMDYIDYHITGKSRPGLVIQNDVGNDNSYNVIIALLTSADKKPYPFQYKIDINGRQNTIMFDQIMTVSKDNLENKIGELTPQQICEADLALMCSLNLLPYSITSIRDFDIVSVVTERTKDRENTYCNIEINYQTGERENKNTGIITFTELKEFDSSIEIDSDIDEIKDKLDNCKGLNFLMNHIQF